MKIAYCSIIPYVQVSKGGAVNNFNSLIRKAYDLMKSGDSQGTHQLLSISKDREEGMSSAVATGLLYLNGKIDEHAVSSLSEYALYTYFMLCEKYKDPCGRRMAESVVRSVDASWQIRCRAIWYLVTLGDKASSYASEIVVLREEFSAGLDYEETMNTPDPAFWDSRMAELQLLGLERIL